MIVRFVGLTLLAATVANAHEPTRVAVVTFEGDAEPYLREGLAAEVAHWLYRLPDVVVQDVPGPGTDVVLTGRLRVTKDRAAVDVLLSTFDGDKEVFAETLAHSRQHLAALPRQIASHVAGSLSPAELPALETVEAYDAYLKALVSESPVETGLAFGHSSYPPAVTLVGSAYLARAGEVGGRGPYYDKAAQALTRAFELDALYPPAREKLASYYAKRGRSEKTLELMLEGRKHHPAWPGFEKTIGYVLRYAGHMEESIRAYKRAQKLDPGLENLVSTQDQITKSYIYMGRYEEALASHRKVLHVLEELGRPANEKQAFYEGVIHLYASDPASAVACFDAGAATDADSVWTTFGRGYRGIALDDRESVEEVLDALERRVVVDGERHYRLVHFAAYLGRVDAALRHLEASIGSGFFNAPYIRNDPLVRPLHGNPRFSALIDEAFARHRAFAEQRERRTLEIASDATFPPFHFIDDGTPTGFDVELAKLVAKRAGLEPRVSVTPYDELLSGLSDAKHDLVAASTGITPERQKTYLFTSPYYATFQAALVRVGPREPSSLAELTGRRVGASGSGTAARAMRSVMGVEHVALTEEGVAPLVDGRVDSIVVDEWHAVEMARASNGTLRVLSEPVATERYAFVLAKGQDALKRELDSALAALTAEGEVAALRARFGVERGPEWPIQVASAMNAVITRGVAQEQGACAVTIDCPTEGNVREAHCGEITAGDGSVWAVPSPITTEGTLVDVYNECTVGGDNPDYEEELETQVVDEGGEEITAYLFGDNYFELYANGEYIGRDAVAFTPFNAHAARIRVDYPVTYAVLLVDWEGYLGVGLEDTRGRFHIGDGGFIATFSDGARTDEEWKCKTFYVAPLDDPGCVAFDEHGNPDSSSCPSEDEAVSCIANDPTRTCRALHLPLPEGWMRPDFDDSAWLPASTYTADEVTGAPGFRNYENTLFRGARFIWTQNLDLDNQVVCRKTVTR